MTEDSTEKGVRHLQKANRDPYRCCFMSLIFGKKLEPRKKHDQFSGKISFDKRSILFGFCWVHSFWGWIISIHLLCHKKKDTSRKTNMYPENQWLVRMVFPIKNSPYVRGRIRWFSGGYIGQLLLLSPIYNLH